MTGLADMKRPLSCAQECRFDAPPGSAVWNVSFALRLEGRLVPEILERALSEIVCRHHILRSEIRVEGGARYLAVCDATRVDLPSMDLEAAADPELEIRRRWADEAGRPFDFPRGPLFRFRLLRADDVRHVLLLTFHHSVLDGRWSFSIFVRELHVLYEAFEQGRPPFLSDLSIQYYDFARAQRQRYSGSGLAPVLARWRARFADAPRSLRLPADRPRPSTPTFRGDAITVMLALGLSKRLKQVCRRERATLFEALLTAWTAVLGDVTGQNKIVVGTAIATRSHPGTKDLIGNFVNFLPLLVDVSGTPEFSEHLRRVRAAVLDACEDPELPIELLVSALAPAIASGGLPQVLFAWHGPLSLPNRISNLRVSMLHPGSLTPTCKTDIHVHIADEHPGPIVLEVEFSTDLFDRKTIERLIGLYREKLETVAAGSTAREAL